MNLAKGTIPVVVAAGLLTAGASAAFSYAATRAQAADAARTADDLSVRVQVAEREQAVARTERDHLHTAVQGHAVQVQTQLDRIESMVTELRQSLLDARTGRARRR